MDYPNTLKKYAQMWAAYCQQNQLDPHNFEPGSVQEFLALQDDPNKAFLAVLAMADPYAFDRLLYSWLGDDENASISQKNGVFSGFYPFYVGEHLMNLKKAKNAENSRNYLPRWDDDVPYHNWDNYLELMAEFGFSNAAGRWFEFCQTWGYDPLGFWHHRVMEFYIWANSNEEEIDELTKFVAYYAAVVPEAQYVAEDFAEFRIPPKVEERVWDPVEARNQAIRDLSAVLSASEIASLVWDDDVPVTDALRAWFRLSYRSGSQSMFGLSRSQIWRIIKRGRLPGAG